FPYTTLFRSGACEPDAARLLVPSLRPGSGHRGAGTGRRAVAARRCGGLGGGALLERPARGRFRFDQHLVGAHARLRAAPARRLKLKTRAACAARVAASDKRLSAAPRMRQVGTHQEAVPVLVHEGEMRGHARHLRLDLGPAELAVAITVGFVEALVHAGTVHGCPFGTHALGRSHQLTANEIAVAVGIDAVEA